MRKKDEAMDGGSEWSAAVGSRVTPQDVQQKEFRVTRVGAGYRMREVDEFLDQITDTLSALIAENDRLRMAGGAAPVPSASQSAPAATLVPDRSGRRGCVPPAGEGVPPGPRRSRPGACRGASLDDPVGPHRCRVVSSRRRRG